MPKPSRWTAEKRYEIVLEMLQGEESINQPDGRASHHATLANSPLTACCQTCE